MKQLSPLSRNFSVLAVAATIALSSCSKYQNRLFDNAYDPSGVYAGPTWLSSFKTFGPAYGISVENNFAYLADYGKGLRIIDVSNPFSPVLTGSYTNALYMNASYTAVKNDFVFYTSGLFFLCLNVMNKSLPVLVDKTNFNSNFYDMALSGNYIYLVFGNNVDGLRIIDVSNPSNIIMRGKCTTPISPIALRVRNNLAYVADMPFGLRIIDVSNPNAPVQKSSLYLTNNAILNIEISGNYAYLTSYYYLYVVDISNPNSPVLFSRQYFYYQYYVVDTGKMLFGFQLWSRYINILSYIQLKNAGSFELPYSASYNYYYHRPLIQNGFLYLTTSDSGLMIYEIKEYN